MENTFIPSAGSVKRQVRLGRFAFEVLSVAPQSAGAMAPPDGQQTLDFGDGPQFAAAKPRRRASKQAGVYPAGSAAKLAGIKTREKQRQAAEGNL